MILTLSVEEARSFLTTYHFRPASVPGVFDRLGAVQYDPLNPVGRNPDLVLQARVPGYRVDDWQEYAYQQRIIYDTWDKQACLAPARDWPNRALIRLLFHPWHDRNVLEDHPAAVEATLREIDERGPLCSLDFEDRSRVASDDSWLGSVRVKRIVRALWVRGILVTHHREGARHYYDRPQRVIPPEYVTAAPLLDEQAYINWIVHRRHVAAGMLRPRANAEVWSVCGDASTRTAAVERLTGSGELLALHVGANNALFHMPTSARPLLDQLQPPSQMLFLGPLDNMMWDRKAVRDIFGFDYIWEVYKKPQDRVWGYYVLPVLWGNRLVARIDSRLLAGTWSVERWWWEDNVLVDAALLDAVQDAAFRFLEYLSAKKITVGRTVDRVTRSALMAAGKAHGGRDFAPRTSI